MQINPAELIAWLTPTFLRRAEPNVALAATALHLSLPGLRGYWPMVHNSSGNAMDQSGTAKTLTYYGNPVYNIYNQIVPYIDFDGTGDYLERADEADLDIIGNEAFEAVPGVTMGCWARFDNALPGNEEYLISKSNGVAAANVAYSLSHWTTGEIRLRVSDGAAGENRDNGTPLAASTWYHVAGRWTPQGTRAVFVNGVKASAASALLTLNNNAANLQLGGRDNGAGGTTRNLAGNMAYAFLCAEGVPDAWMFLLYQGTRAAFGV